MITNLAFAYDYVSDIPWDKNPAFAFSDDTDKYLSAFKHVVECKCTINRCFMR